MMDECNGLRLYQYIANTKATLLGLSIWSDEERQNLSDRLTLTIEYNKKNAEKLRKGSWEEYHFQDVPVVAVTTLLNKLRNDALNSRDLVLEKIYEKVNK